jgi:Flp pilus assembly protein TadG
MHTAQALKRGFVQLLRQEKLKAPCSLIEKLRTDQDGSQTVEFALCSVVWLLAVFVIIYISFLFYADHFVTSAAKNAARYAVVRGSSWNGASCHSVSSSSCTATAANVTSYVQASLFPGISSSQLTVSTSWPGTTSSGAICDTTNGTDSPNCAVNVQVGYSFSFPMPFFPNTSIPLAATSQMTIME